MSGGKLQVLASYDGSNPANPYNNTKKSPSGMNRGNAVWANRTYHKNTTVGPTDILYYNDSVHSTSGW